MRKAVVASPLLLCAVLFSSEAHAQHGEREVTYVSPGITLGAARGDFVGGGEVSIGHADIFYVPIAWYGGYADFVYDTGIDHGRVSFGPQLGVGPIGVDGGPVIATHGRLGGNLRLVMGLPYVMGYVRGTIIDDPRGVFVGEVGLLMKAPVRLRSR